MRGGDGDGGLGRARVRVVLVGLLLRQIVKPRVDRD
jgi:hypothetical protein